MGFVEFIIGISVLGLAAAWWQSEHPEALKRKNNEELPNRNNVVNLYPDLDDTFDAMQLQRKFERY